MRKFYKVFNPKLYLWWYNIYKQFGYSALKELLESTFLGYIKYYNKWLENHLPSQEELNLQRKENFRYSPSISIVVPTYNTPIKFLKEMINSVLSQTYKHWELCIVDGSSSNSVVDYINKNYSKEKRIKFFKLKSNKGISGNTNEAIKYSTGEYISFLDHDDIIPKNTLYEVVKCLQEKKHDLIYTDEDYISEDSAVHKNPTFKPDWSPDLLMSHNYITHFVTIKRDIIKKVGYLQSKYDGSQDYDFLLRAVEQCDSIYHIPKILYHWRENESSVAGDSSNKMYAFEAGKNALQDYINRNNISGKVECLEHNGYYKINYKIPNPPKLSILIPNMNHIDDLKKCIDSLYNNNIYKNFEVIIIENNSTEEDIFEYYKFLKYEYKNIKIVTYKGDFNFSAINNFGFKFAEGEYILFLNNDTELIKPDSLQQMIGNCMRDDVGIVGAKLLFKDRTIQHAGTVLGFGGFAGHVFSGIKEDSCGYMWRPQISCNYSAVTGACLLIKRKVFEAVGGFNEDFKVGLNDIDLCLKVIHSNKLVVYNGNTLWFHYESKSRGYDTTKEKQKRLNSEIALFQKIWKLDLDNPDPYYTPNFTTDSIPYKILN